MGRAPAVVALALYLVAGQFIFKIPDTEYELPAERVPSGGTWTNVGVTGGIPTNRTQCTGAWGTNFDTTDCSGGSCEDEIETALNSCSTETYLQLGSGTFTAAGDITVPEQVTLRGSGTASTTITWTATQVGVVLGWNGQPFFDDIYQATGNNTTISGSPAKGATSVTVASSSGFAAGDLAIVAQELGEGHNENAPHVGAALESPDSNLGQMVKIASVSGTTITFETALLRTFNASFDPRLYRARPFGQNASYYRAALENIKLTRPNASGGTTPGIQIAVCDECWVKNIEFERGCFRNVMFHRSYRSQLRDSFLYKSCSYQSGGNGYLLSLHGFSSNNLIENNIVMFANENLFIENAAGNVVAYNFFDGAWLNENESTLQMADYGTHAPYPHMSLFEGNFAAKFEQGGVWGDAEYLLFFRNYHDLLHEFLCSGCDPEAIGGFTPAQTQDSACFQMGPTAWHTTYVGNVCGKTGQDVQYESGPAAKRMFYFRSAPQEVEDEALRGYNLVYPGETLTWGDVPMGQAIPDSLYLSAKPSWWEDQSAMGKCRPWPPIGPDVSGYFVDIPAKDRFEGETYNGNSC